ncbi:MAG TPA: glycosyltransferase family 2 protein [bacterium]|nr:glycosyltransferase family 2 protein [bacterium]
MNLYSIIPVYNRKNITLQCLNDLKNQTYKSFEIIVFDDGSSDGTKEAVKSEHPDVIILNGDGNHWWTRSVNESVKFAISQNADYVLILNDDVRLDKDFIKKIIDLSSEFPESIIGAVNYDLHSGRVLFAGEKRNWLFASIKKNADIFSEYELSSLKKIESDYLPGRGLMIPAEAFKKIGFFDEKNFPQSAADYDFTLRAKKNNIDLFCNAEIKQYSDSNNLGAAKFPVDKFKNIFPYTTSLKSAGCLRIRWKFIIKNCPKKFLTACLISDTGRVVLGFLKKYIKFKLNIK